MKKKKRIKSSKKTKQESFLQKIILCGLFLLIIASLSVLFYIQNQKVVLGITTTTNATAIVNGEVVLIPQSLRFANGAVGNPVVHATGAIPSTIVIKPHVTRLSFVENFLNTVTRAQAAANMSSYNLPIGNQGGIGSCVAWALGYYLRGWYAIRDGYYPSGGFAPMFIYSQLYKKYACYNPRTDPLGCGLAVEDAVKTLRSTGIDAQSHYTQGNYSVNPPTQAEFLNARKYGLSPSVGITPYEFLFSGHNVNSSQDVSNSDSTIETVIKQSIDKGQPMVIDLPVFRNFDDANSQNFLIGLPTQEDLKTKGLHEVFAFDYNNQGLWILNQWGTNWGHNGGALLSWSYVNQYVIDALVISPSSKTTATQPYCKGACMTNTHLCSANDGKLTSNQSCLIGVCCNFPLPPTPTSKPNPCSYFTGSPGFYCGGHANVRGDANTLYHCSSNKTGSAIGSCGATATCTWNGYSQHVVGSFTPGGGYISGPDDCVRTSTPCRPNSTCAQ